MYFISEKNCKNILKQKVFFQNQIFKNFYSDWERSPTDGFEEQVVLYRIHQNLKLVVMKKKKSLGAKPVKENSKEDTGDKEEDSNSDE